MAVEIVNIFVFPTEVYCWVGGIGSTISVWIDNKLNIDLADDECIDVSARVYVWTGSRWKFMCGRDVSCIIQGPTEVGQMFSFNIINCKVPKCEEFTELPLKTRLKIEVKYWKFKVTEVHDYTKPPLASDVKYVEILVKPPETLKSEIKIDKTKIVKGETINISVKLSKQSVM